MRAAFRMFDLDGNGLIDSDELRLAMSRLGETVTEADVDAMIRAVDRNNDGKVDYEGQPHCRTISVGVRLSVCLSRSKHLDISWKFFHRLIAVSS